MEHKVKALILAAGKGTRLRTEGCDIPKVMRICLLYTSLGYIAVAAVKYHTLTHKGRSIRHNAHN